MKKLLIGFMLLTSMLSYAETDTDIVNSKVETRGSKTFDYIVTTDNIDLLDGKCIVSKDYSDTSFVHGADNTFKSLRLKVMMDDRRTETGNLYGSLYVRKTEAQEESFCDRADCSPLAAVTLPIWVVPVLVYGGVHDVRRALQNKGFLKETFENLDIPNCEE